MVPQELHFLADASAFMLPGPAQAQDEEEDDEEVEGHGKHNQLNTWVILSRYPGTMRYFLSHFAMEASTWPTKSSMIQ